MSAISSFYEPIRVLIGDNDPDIQLREDSQLAAAVRTVLNLGKVVSADEATTYAVSGTTAVTPDLTAASDAVAYAKLVFRAAQLFVTDMTPIAWRTRAFSESIGENREKVFHIMEEIWRLENGDGCASSDYE